jgi:hypothetical protein
MKIHQHFDRWSLAVIAITLVLFMAALWVKGPTHDLFLEAGVFLVSVKLIQMAYKANVANELLHQKLNEILTALEKIEQSGSNTR